MDLPASVGNVALAQPTRAKLFRLLGELMRPAGTEELANELGLHANGVRLHLDRLAEAGLVSRTRERRPRGRPRDQWSIAPGARPDGNPPNAHADLGRWLARAIPARPSRLRDVEAAGRQIGRDMAPSGGVSAQAAIHSTLSALGFKPDTEASGATLTCTLGNCPYREAVKANQKVVCTLHRGITRGLIDVIDPKARLTSFVPRDPDEAGCLVEVAGVASTS